MKNNALETKAANEFTLDKDFHPFRDEQFKQSELSREEEIVYNDIQMMDLSDAKQLFASLSIEMKIKSMRYICSRRLFDSILISEDDKKKLDLAYMDSFGSLCAMDESGTQTISLESHVITRILYISESMSIKEFYRMENELTLLDLGYIVITQVIKSRLRFRRWQE